MNFEATKTEGKKERERGERNSKVSFHMSSHSFVLSSVASLHNRLDIFIVDSSTIPAIHQGSLLGRFSVLLVLTHQI